MEPVKLHHPDESKRRKITTNITHNNNKKTINKNDNRCQENLLSTKPTAQRITIHVNNKKGSRREPWNLEVGPRCHGKSKRGHWELEAAPWKLEAVAPGSKFSVAFL